MSVACQILINKTKEGYYKPGSSVTGRIKYSIDKPTEYKAVTLSFLGLGECIWTERSKNTSTTYVGKEELINVVHDLLQAKETTAVLDEGVYEYPFEFLLPENVPSTYSDAKSKIFYCIVLKFERPKVFSFNKLFTTVVPVKGYVEPTPGEHVIFGLEKTLTDFFSIKKPVIKIKAEIEKIQFTPGDNINTSLLVTNNTDLTTNVRVSLYCHKTYTANCGRTTTTFEKVKESRLELMSVPPQGVANLTQSLPTNKDVFSITTKVLRKEYRVRVSVKVPMPHRNEFVEMPVVIGDLNAELDVAASSYEDVQTVADAPPSYWEVMGEYDEEIKEKDDVK